MNAPIAISPSAPHTPSERTGAIDALRSFLTVLVVLLHSVMAYTTWAQLDKENYAHGSTSPVVDPIRWVGFDLVPALLNSFFMAQMFFISGLFVWKSLARKGSAGFLGDRFKRLGIPWMLTTAFVMPVAFYPSYLMVGGTASPAAYWLGWSWTSGPGWFLTMLLAFNAAAALLFIALGKSPRQNPGWASAVFERPWVFLLTLTAVSTACLLPMLYIFGPFWWISCGPVIVTQAARPLLYAAYFLGGIAAGVHGVERGILASEGPLARRWLLWIVAALVGYVVFLAAVKGLQTDPAQPWIPASAGWLQFGMASAVCCALCNLALLAVFLRFVRGTHPFMKSLSASAFGIYLLHYPAVTWLQFGLLNQPLSAPLKATLVFLGALALSWALTAAGSAILRPRRSP